MKKLSAILSILIITILLSGCYESQYPLKGTKQPIKTELLGNWISEHFPKMKIIQISDTDYFVMFSNQDEGVTLGKAYSTKISDVDIIIFQELSSGKNNYWFFKYNCSKEANTYALSVQSISSKFIEKSKPKDQIELQKIVEMNINNDEMFDPPQTFLKLLDTKFEGRLNFPKENNQQ